MFGNGRRSSKSPFYIFLGDCFACGEPISKEASLVGKTHFHPDCFRCAKCREPLGTKKFFVIDGKNYCEKDREVRETSNTYPEKVGRDQWKMLRLSKSSKLISFLSICNL